MHRCPRRCLVALLIVWRFRHMLLTLASGMAVLWLVPLVV